MILSSAPSSHPWPAGDDPDRVRDVVVRRYTVGQVSQVNDEVATEEPLEIQIDGQTLAVIMRTPGQDEFLAAGFLLSEGIIHDAAAMMSVGLGLDREGFPQPNVLDIRLHPEVDRAGVLRRREFVVSSSCGLCGTSSVAAVSARIDPLPVGDTTSPQILLSLESKIRAYQSVFRRTGGLHAAGLFDVAGSLIVVHEDVGRHNAVDKVLGQMLLERRLPLRDRILMVSGRASFELVQKAAIAGVPILAAVGAPSSLAIEMAVASHLTLIGLLRDGRFNVYSWPERVRFGD